MNGREAVEALALRVRQEMGLLGARLEGVEMALELLGPEGAAIGAETRQIVGKAYKLAPAPQLALPAAPKAGATKAKKARGRRKDPERDAKVLQLSKAGTGATEIARQVGLTDTGVRGILKRLGAKPVRKSVTARDKKSAEPAPPAAAAAKASPSLDERIAKLSKLGKWDDEIARELGVTGAEIRAALIRTGGRAAL